MVGRVSRTSGAAAPCQHDASRVVIQIICREMLQEGYKKGRLRTFFVNIICMPKLIFMFYSIGKRAGGMLFDNIEVIYEYNAFKHSIDIEYCMLNICMYQTSFI